MTLETLFINLAYILMFLGLAVRDMLKLRALLIAANASFIAFACLASNFPMTFWNAVFIGLNTWHIIRLWRERRPLALPPELQAIHEKSFEGMTSREFLTIWEMGQFFVIADERLIDEGTPLGELMIVEEGTVAIKKGEKEIARAGAGDFLAEMSYFTGEPASATVAALGVVRYRAWDREKLARLRQINPGLYIKLQGILGRGLSHKVARFQR